MKLNEIIAAIPGADEMARQGALDHWNTLAKPLGSLGMLENAVVKVAALTGDANVRLDRRTLLVLCADNGVVARGVTQTDASVTLAVARALSEGTSTVNYQANPAGCRVIPVDMGMLPHPPVEGLIDRCIRPGTADMTEEPAMTREECIAAIEAGIRLAEEQKQAGTQLILAGEMGIGNTTTSAAVAAVLLGSPAAELVGRGAGLSDEGLLRKRRAVETAIARNCPDRDDPIDVLAKVGGLDLAGLCGLCIGGAYHRIPVLLDGLITTVAALCAVRLCPAVRDALLASHTSAEPAARGVMEELGLEAPIQAGFRLGEGSGGVMALGLLDQTLAVYHSGHTFGEMGIEAYTPQS